MLVPGYVRHHGGGPRRDVHAPVRLPQEALPLTVELGSPRDVLGYVALDTRWDTTNISRRFGDRFPTVALIGHVVEGRPTLGSVSVVVVNYDGADDTLACIESLASLEVDEDRLEIIVVDNGSPATTSSALRAAGSDVHVVALRAERRLRRWLQRRGRARHGGVPCRS